MQTEIRLSKYGEYLIVYDGEGNLTFDDAREVPCEFQAGQLKDACVLLYVKIFIESFEELGRHFGGEIGKVVRFAGTTTDGRSHLSASQDFGQFSFETSAGSEGSFTQMGVTDD